MIRAIRFQTFCAAYVNGEEPENDAWVLDFGEWASICRTWLPRQPDYRNEIKVFSEMLPV